MCTTRNAQWESARWTVMNKLTIENISTFLVHRFTT